MKASLAKLSQLPATTRIFCGHEYTVGFGVDMRMVGGSWRGAVLEVTMAEKWETNTSPELRPGQLK